MSTITARGLLRLVFGNFFAFFLSRSASNCQRARLKAWYASARYSPAFCIYRTAPTWYSLLAVAGAIPDPCCAVEMVTKYVDTIEQTTSPKLKIYFREIIVLSWNENRF